MYLQNIQLLQYWHGEKYLIKMLLLSSELLFTKVRAAWVVDEREGPWLGRSLLVLCLMKCYHGEEYPINMVLLSSELLLTALRATWVVDEGEGPWLGRSLLAMHLEQFADWSVRRWRRLFFAEAENGDLHQEKSVVCFFGYFALEKIFLDNENNKKIRVT